MKHKNMKRTFEDRPAHITSQDAWRKLVKSLVAPPEDMRAYPPFKDSGENETGRYWKF